MSLTFTFDRKEEIKKPVKFLQCNKEEYDGKKTLFLNNNSQFKEEYFPKRPALDLTFKNVRYTVSTWNKLKSGKCAISHIILKDGKKVQKQFLNINLKGRGIDPEQQPRLETFVK